jgi:hypothetical protein
MRQKIVNVFIRMSLAGLVGLALTSSPRECRADAKIAKGITGGAFIGAEVVMVTEAAFGVKPKWAYVVGGVAGAGAGAAGGYFIADGSSNKTTSFLLAGSLALVMPTMIAVVMATDFQPPPAHKQEPTIDEEGPAEAQPPLPGARLELPTVNVAQAFTSDELSKYGMRQTTEYHFSLLRGVF